MTICCPVCKAEVNAGPACRRCKADLGMLFALEEQRTVLFQQARQSLESGLIDDAMQAVRAAANLRRDADSQRWTALVHLLAGRFDDAWRSYQLVNQRSPDREPRKIHSNNPNL